MWPFTRKPAPAPVKIEPKVRSYVAASTTARYGDFRKSKGSADYELIGGLAAIREKARFLARNSSTMMRFIQLLQDNLIGEAGFTLRSAVKMTDGKPDRRLNALVEEAWAEWWSSPTVDGQMDGTDLLHQMVATWARDGECFIEIVRNARFKNGIGLNPIEADLVDETLNTIYPPTGNQIRLGVEVDELGRAVAYHVLTQHPGDSGWHHTKANRKYRRVSADLILHVYERLRPGQTRGQPPASMVVNPLKMLDGYREAEVTGRRVAASTMGFFTKDKPTSNGIDALATDQDAETGELEISLEPGTFKELPAGMSFEKFDATGSTTDYAEFETAVKRDISMGFGISAFSLGMETDKVSFSTSRSVLLEDRAFYLRKRRMFIRVVMKIFGLWFPMHLLADDCQIPPSKSKNVLKHISFQGQGWSWVDPLKDIKANSEALRTRQTSLSRIAASQGIDFIDLLAEIAEDEARMAELGITVTFSEQGQDLAAQGGEDGGDAQGQ